MSGIKRARDSLSDELVAAKKARDEKSCDLDTSKKACDALSSELAKSKKAYDLLTNQLGAVKKESREQASEMFNILAARDEAVSRAHQLEVELAKVNREAAAGRKLREIWNVRSSGS
jgi:chromosome segregation ATPase